MKMPKIKIFVSYYKAANLIESEILTPVHTGRDIIHKFDKDGISDSERNTKWLIDNMIGDNTGDNISVKNNQYCELTAQYWAWKNYSDLGQPDFIGFMHYRRHFIFSDNQSPYLPPKLDNMYRVFDKFDDQYISQIGLKDKDIIKSISGFDGVVFEMDLVTNHIDQFSDLSKTMNLRSEIFNEALEVIKVKQPSYIDIANEYINQNLHYGFHMFILNKELFFDYSEWLFSLLSELENNCRNCRLSVVSERSLGFVAERLQGIYFYNLIKNKEKKIKRMPISYIENTEINYDIFPSQEKDCVSICFNSSKEYLKYLAVTIQSIIDNSSVENSYSIFVMSENLAPKDKFPFELMVRKQINFTIYFVEVGRYLDGRVRSKHNNYPNIVYNKFLISRIFINFKKILFLDIDLILCDDVAKLFSCNMDDAAICACHDIVLNYFSSIDKNLKNYVANTLEIKNEYTYFNTGVMLYNPKKCYEQSLEEKLFDGLKDIPSPLIAEQDIHNYICNKYSIKVKFLDAKWNIDLNAFSCKLSYPFEYYWFRDEMESYLKALKSPGILHFAGGIKPWQGLNQEHDFIFWQYARKTPFYETLIKQVNNTSQLNNNPSFSITGKLKKNISILTKKSINFIFPYGSRQRHILKSYSETKPFKLLSRLYHYE